ncbi:Brix domain-containing protein [Geopyxis carbonaria]|nr:Brix domain-containing protein [Geopyxis carbonaria]
MIRTIAPKNARSKRALDDRAPKNKENPKTTLLLRGTTASETVQSVLTDLHALKKPHSIKFSKKNDGVRPFEDASSLEFFSSKNDAALLVVGSHSKKRPHNVVVARCFEHRILDLFEFGVDPQSYRGVATFPGQKAAVGMKPMLLFSGSAWESDAKWRGLKNLWMDFFRGEEVKSVDVEGLQYVISFLAAEPEEGRPSVFHIRGCMIETKKSGQKLPRVEVREMGPRMDLTVRRTQEASEEMMKEALRKPRTTEARTKKNITMDIIGDKIGRIHTGKQDLNKLQSRKMKGLRKRGADDGDDAATLVDDDMEIDGDDADEAPASPKKARRE